MSELQNEKVYWTHKMNTKLVRFMERRPNIWNPKHPKYTSLKYRNKTYADFAAKYGNQLSKESVKLRWTNIRSTFCNYLRKFQTHQAQGSLEEFKVNWHLWQTCQFLKSVHKKNKNTSCFTEDMEEMEVINEDTWDGCKIFINEKPKEVLENKIEYPQNFDVQCQKIVDNLVTVFKSVQNDVFGLENTKHCQIGKSVAMKLSKVSSFDADLLINKITDILLLYNECNPLNPNNLEIKR